MITSSSSVEFWLKYYLNMTEFSRSSGELRKRQLSNNQPNPGLSNVWIFWNSKSIPGKSASDCPNDVFTFVFTKKGKLVRCKIIRIINDNGSARVQEFFWNLNVQNRPSTKMNCTALLSQCTNRFSVFDNIFCLELSAKWISEIRR